MLYIETSVKGREALVSNLYIRNHLMGLYIIEILAISRDFVGVTPKMRIYKDATSNEHIHHDYVLDDAYIILDEIIQKHLLSPVEGI